MGKLFMLFVAAFLIVVLLTGGKAFASEGEIPPCSEAFYEQWALGAECEVSPVEVEQEQLEIEREERGESEPSLLEVEVMEEVEEGSSKRVSVEVHGSGPAPGASQSNPPSSTGTPARHPCSACVRCPRRARCRTHCRSHRHRKGRAKRTPSRKVKTCKTSN